MSEPNVSMSNITTPVAGPLVKSDVQWLFVSQKRNGKLYLYTVTLNLDDTMFIAMHKLRAEYHRIKLLPPYHFYDQAWIFWKPIIEQAILSEVRTSLPQPLICPSPSLLLSLTPPRLPGSLSMSLPTCTASLVLTPIVSRDTKISNYLLTVD
jgi:hypothetical protein